MVHDSRVIQVTLFGTLQRNLGALDFSLLLPDVLTIADEVDSQLTQAMVSFTNVVDTTATDWLQLAHSFCIGQIYPYAIEPMA